MSSRLPPTRPAHCSRAEGEGAESGDRLGSTEIAGCTKAARCGRQRRWDCTTERQTCLCTFTGEFPTLTERYGEVATSRKDQLAFCASLGGTPMVDMYCKASSCRREGACMANASRSLQKERKDKPFCGWHAGGTASCWARHHVVLGARKQPSSKIN